MVLCGKSLGWRAKYRERAYGYGFGAANLQVGQRPTHCRTGIDNVVNDGHALAANLLSQGTGKAVTNRVETGRCWIGNAFRVGEGYSQSGRNHQRDKRAFG
jgi:hypothetical protein